MKSGFFSRKVAEWYHLHHRDLPWRRTQDPYKIWLSEIILQQTRVQQGLPYYLKFVHRFPTVAALAKAREVDVLRLWQGLGYYTRGRNLLACARHIVKTFAGKFPRRAAELNALPGVGLYTSSAIASLAFGEKVGVVDGNVVRVLARHFGLFVDPTSGKGRKVFGELANRLAQVNDPGTHNQALMEFGALHCVPRNPGCEDCPVQKSCYAFANNCQENLPLKKRRAKVRHRYFYYLLVRRGNGVLMVKRKGKDIWKGLFDFPLIEKNRKWSDKELLVAMKRKENGKRNESLAISEEYRHILTHQIIHARFIEGLRIPRNREFQEWMPADVKVCSPAAMEKLPKPVLITRYLTRRGIQGES